MRTADLDYDLPERLIAQEPAPHRDESRMLVLDRAAGSVREDVYRNVASYLRRGDSMVLNDTRVIPARLLGRKSTGGRVEVFLLRPLCTGENGAAWEALVRPSAKVRPGTDVTFAEGLEARVGGQLSEGHREVWFSIPDVMRRLEESGVTPLPPYIRRNVPRESDKDRYQTVYAVQSGAVAAPTAGLHLTDRVFESLDAAGVSRVKLTLHVGYGTFKPVQTETLAAHSVDPEDFVFPQETAAVLNAARTKGGRVVSVGTTCARVLETQWQDGAFVAGTGRTDTYIYPPYTFKGVDVLQTNFHLPKSSLLALVCAFAGTQFVMDAYRYAVEKEFRFYSYGDVMLVL